MKEESAPKTWKQRLQEKRRLYPITEFNTPSQPDERILMTIQPKKTQLSLRNLFERPQTFVTDYQTERPESTYIRRWNQKKTQEEEHKRILALDKQVNDRISRISASAGREVTMCDKTLHLAKNLINEKSQDPEEAERKAAEH